MSTERKLLREVMAEEMEKKLLPRELLPRDLDGASLRRPHTEEKQMSQYVPPPPNPDPIKMAGLILKSVHKVGVEAGREVDEVAEMLLQGAQEVADNLRRLADAIRGHSDEASRHVEVFAAKATAALEGVRGLAEEFSRPPQPEPVAVDLDAAGAVTEAAERLKNGASA